MKKNFLKEKFEKVSVRRKNFRALNYDFYVATFCQKLFDETETVFSIL